MASSGELGRLNRTARPTGRLAVARLLLPLGWALAAIGYYGPWIHHATAALTLSGSDMAEFVKFLPGVLAGTLDVVRQTFYLPPLAVVSSVAWLVASRRLAYAWPLRLVSLVLSVPLSLQLLPPAWSPASLASPEFRLQAVTLAVCWLLLATSWLLGRSPVGLAGLFAACLSIAGCVLPAWQFALAKPAIDAVYGTAPAPGWGLFLCLGGLAIVGTSGLMLALPARQGSWTRR
jgi:hypothetical protein